MILAVILAVGVIGPHQVESNPALRTPRTWDDHITLSFSPRIHSSGLEGSQLLKVYVGAQDHHAVSPVQGRYTWSPGHLTFKPYYAFGIGQPYAVEWKVGNYRGTAEFMLPPSARTSKEYLVKFFPTSGRIPSNILRFYAQFSRSARDVVKSEHVHLYNLGGIEVKNAFINLGQELWSPDGRRLTLLLDPARIKQGVTAFTTLGPLLQENHRYQIKIIKGEKIYKSAQIEVGSPIRSPLDQKKWQVSPIPIGTRLAIKIRFDHMMDWALLQDSIVLRGKDGEFLEGRVQVDTSQRNWQFVPSKPWKSGDRVTFNPSLEDVAGNRLDEALDHTTDRQRKEINGK